MMARENMEDYRASFLVLLETWEAAVNFHNPELRNSRNLSYDKCAKHKKVKTTQVAELLGWVRKHTDKIRSDDRLKLSPLVIIVSPTRT